MHAIVWSDYICPWAYLGRDRTALLRSLGVTVTSRPYELHPDLPPEGRAVRPDGRLARVHADIARQCADVGMPFRAPTLVPNSRRALETAEVVRAIAPASFDAIDDALFAAHFVHGVDIADADALDTVVAGTGLDAARVREAVDAGEGSAAVVSSINDAHEHGVAATPAWLFLPELVIPGAQPRELFERIVARLRTRLE